jgi:hypothetical protein
MKLYSRNFVRSLRGAALVRIRASKVLRREHRRRRRRFQFFSLRTLFIYGLLAFFTASWTFSIAQKKPEFTFLVVSFYCTGTVAFRSRSLGSRLHGPAELSIFFGLPIIDRDFFSLQWRKFLFRTGWVFAFVFLLYAIRELQEQTSVFHLLLLAVPTALAQWLLVISLSALILEKRYQWTYQIGLAAYAAIVGAAVAPEKFTAAIARLGSMLPAGWINRAYIGVAAGRSVSVLWIVPVGVVVALGLTRVHWLRERYRPLFFHEFHYPSAEEMVDWNQAELTSPIEQQPSDIIPDLLSRDVATSRLNSGELELVRDWNALGIIERVAGWCVTGHDRVVADFMLGDSLGDWSSGWLKGFYITSGVILSAALIPQVPSWLTVGAAFIAGFYAAPVLGGKWLGFSPVIVSMKQSSVKAFYPVSYWQASRVIFTINLVRLLAYSVLLLPTVLAVSS